MKFKVSKEEIYKHLKVAEEGIGELPKEVELEGEPVECLMCKFRKEKDLPLCSTHREKPKKIEKLDLDKNWKKAPLEYELYKKINEIISWIDDQTG